MHTDALFREPIVNVPSFVKIWASETFSLPGHHDYAHGSFFSCRTTPTNVLQSAATSIATGKQDSHRSIETIAFVCKKKKTFQGF